MTEVTIKIHDVVYGEFEISNPLVVKLINSLPMQRLKGIDMAGYSTGYYPKSSHSRFEHSVGVYHLLSKHGASLEECVHGLLHDVSHTAFSHAVDYALDDASGKHQDFQDQIFHRFVNKTEIPGILREFGLDPEFVFNEEHFSLQETSIPDVCADRLDYSFRGLFHYKILPLPEIKSLIQSLRNNQKEWFFESQESAQKYAEAFSRIDDEIYDSLKGAAMLNSVGECIKYSLSKGVLLERDLFETDQDALTKIHTSLGDDKQLNRLWERMNGRVPYRNDKKNYTSVVHCKSRIVDPKFVSSDGSLKRLTDVLPQWQPIVEEGLKPKTYHLKFLD